MKVTRYTTEEDEFSDLDAEDQLGYIKNELFEFTGRVVVAVGLALAGLWNGFNSTPHSFTTHTGEVARWTTTDIVVITLVLLAAAGYVGYSAYKRRERILNAIQAIQSDHARDSE